MHAGASGDSEQRNVGAIKALLLSLNERVSETVLHSVMNRNSKNLTMDLIPFKIFYNIFQDKCCIFKAM